MIKGQISTGFCYEIDEEKLDDMEFVEALAEANEDVLKIPSVIKAMLGAEQKKELYEHLRDESGKITITAVMKALYEIMETDVTTKN